MLGIHKLHRKGGFGRFAIALLGDLRIMEKMVTWRGSIERKNENHEEPLILLLVILIISDKATLFLFMNERSSDSSIYNHKKGDRGRRKFLLVQTAKDESPVGK